ncbi:MAG TPA: HAD family hydrolase [Ramlibacter sp.]|nr:HAD family hydrolase [Ramlibacter sp.]
MSGARRAVFFDRDGVLNRALVRDGKPYPPRDLSEFVIPAGARDDLERLKRLGFLLIVVTNQPDLARGSATPAGIEAMHQHLRRELPVDDVLVCPHDDDDGCDCRKPLPGLLTRAAQRHGIDLENSFLVGDRWRDIDAGHAAGCFTVWIDREYHERGPDRPPGARVGSLHDAVALILEKVSVQENA